MLKVCEKDLTLAKRKNLIAYTDWLRNGKLEGDDTLNDSNRDVIEAYACCYPEAVCVNTHSGEMFSPLETRCHNFACSCVFNGVEANINAVKTALDAFRKNPSTAAFDNFEKTIENAHPMHIIWA